MLLNTIPHDDQERILREIVADLTPDEILDLDQVREILARHFACRIEEQWECECQSDAAYDTALAARADRAYDDRS